METLGLLGAAAAFFAVGLALVLYELSRIKAGRPILRRRCGAELLYHLLGDVCSRARYRAQGDYWIARGRR